MCSVIDINLLFVATFIFQVTQFASPNGFYSVYRRICFRVAHRATALHSYKAVESSLS